MKNRTFVLILLAIAAGLFFFKLGDMALTDPDETFYAQTAKEMLAAQEWVTPTIFGQPQFEKPVFYYWLVRISFMTFGVNEFAARVPSAIFGILGIIGVYLLGRFLFSPLCGFLSGLILATCMQYVVLSRACVTDMVLTVFILLCLLFFLYGWKTEKRIHYLVASIMAGLAVLTKGPIGLFIPGVTVILYITFSRQWPKVKKIPIFWCVLTFLAVCLPWYLAVTRVHGTTFIGEFFGFQNVTRFLKPEHRIGTSPFFYIPVIIGGFFPWSFFLIFGAWNMYKSGGKASSIKAHRMFLAVWFLVVFVFFSISRTKLVTYIFPLFPVAAIIAGSFWEKFITNGESAKDKRMKISYSIFAITSFLAAIGVLFFVMHEYPQALKGAVIAGGSFTLGLLASAFLFIRKKKNLSLYAIVISASLLLIPTIIYVLPVVEKSESSKAVSQAVNRLSKPAEPLGGEDDHRRGIAFYADRTDVVDIHPYGALKSFINRKERVWCIIQEKHYRQFKENKDGKISEPLFQSGKYVVVNNRP